MKFPKLIRTIASALKRKKLFAASLLLNVILILALTFALQNIARTRSSNMAIANKASDQTKAPDDDAAFEETFKETFIANCVIQAKRNVGKAAANTYCACVLDRGIEIHGLEKFTEINQQIMKTYDMSELKGIIDECVTKATAS